MRSTVKSVLSYGRFHRIWPATDRFGNVYVTVSAIRSFVKPVCKIFKSEDEGDSWIQLADFYQMDEKNSTTGQPFIMTDGTILVPVWDYRYYQLGRTGLTIYRSKNDGSSWERVYESSFGTYGNHFFEGKSKDEIYLCAGMGGGGSENKVGYIPDQGILLKSQDSGKKWEICLKVDTPTAIYDGTFCNDTIIVSARDRGSIFTPELRPPRPFFSLGP